MWKKAADKKFGGNKPASTSSSSGYTPPKPTSRPAPSYHTEKSVVSTYDVRDHIGYIGTIYIGWPNKGSLYVDSIYVDENRTNEFGIKIEVRVHPDCKITDWYTEDDFRRDLDSALQEVCNRASSTLDGYASRLGFDYEIEVEVTGVY